jgi:hypothetical protein
MLARTNADLLRSAMTIPTVIAIVRAVMTA